MGTCHVDLSRRPLDRSQRVLSNDIKYVYEIFIHHDIMINCLYLNGNLSRRPVMSTIG